MQSLFQVEVRDRGWDGGEFGRVSLFWFAMVPLWALPAIRWRGWVPGTMLVLLAVPVGYGVFYHWRLQPALRELLDELEDEAARRFRGALSRLALLVGEAAVAAVLPARLASAHSALDARVMLALVIGLIAAFVVVAVRLTYPSYAAYRRGGGQLARVYTELAVVGMVATVLISAAAWRLG